MFCLPEKTTCTPAENTLMKPQHKDGKKWNGKEMWGERGQIGKWSRMEWNTCLKSNCQQQMCLPPLRSADDPR